MAGYSGTPLPRKLGIKPGHVLLLDNPPADWDGRWPAAFAPLPDRVTMIARPRGRAPADIILAFFTAANRLERRFAALKSRMKPDSALWIAWPKKASKRPTDLTGNVVRAVALAGGLVDVKVCAVDDVWSGLKLVYRTADRPQVGRPKKMAGP